MFRNYASICGEVLLVRRRNSKLKDRPLSAVRGCLFNIFATTFRIGSRSYIRNLRKRHAMLTGAHLSWIDCSYFWSVCRRGFDSTNKPCMGSIHFLRSFSFLCKVFPVWPRSTSWNNRVYFYETSYWFQFFSPSGDFDWGCYRCNW